MKTRRDHLIPAKMAIINKKRWRKGNPCTLLVGMQFGAAFMENSVEVPQKMKDRATSSSLLGIYLKN